MGLSRHRPSPRGLHQDAELLQQARSLPEMGARAERVDLNSLMESGILMCCATSALSMQMATGSQMGVSLCC